MPVKWTPENKALLLGLLFKTHQIPVDYGAIVKAWPGDDKPTAKALTHQIAAMKSGSNITATPTSTPTKRGRAGKDIDGETPTPTPKKRAVTKSRAKKTVKDYKEDETESSEISDNTVSSAADDGEVEFPELKHLRADADAVANGAGEVTGCAVFQD